MRYFALVVCAALTRAQQTAIPQWSLSAAPIQTLDGEFLHIRAVFRLSSGVVAVVNAGTQELKLFDGQGRPLRSFGRKGSGPGEFQNIGWAGRVQDTALFYDGSLSRITRLLLGAEPRLLNTLLVTAKSERGRFSVGGQLPDGRWLAVTTMSPTWDGPPGVHRVPGSAGLFAPAATGAVNWLGEFPSAAIFVNNPTGNLQQASVGPIAFPPWFHAVASGSYIWMGESGSDSLVRVGPAATDRRRVVLPFPRRAPTPDLIAGVRAEEGTPSDPVSLSFQNAKLSPKYLPRWLPFFTRPVPGFDGEIWVPEYAAIRSAATRYLVIAPSAELRAWVTVPAGFRVSEVGSDHVVGVYEDGDGVETVRVYGLRRH